MGNIYFERESFENDIELDVNLDVLNRIYGDGITPSDKLNIEFFFLTNTKDKAEVFKNILQKSYPKYKEIKTGIYKDSFEVSGVTAPIQMSLLSINEWNMVMWNLGYKYDCKLDGWQVGI